VLDCLTVKSSSRTWLEGHNSDCFYSENSLEGIG